jgi:hypothetical protein
VLLTKVTTLAFGRYDHLRCLDVGVGGDDDGDDGQFVAAVRASCVPLAARTAL